MISVTSPAAAPAAAPPRDVIAVTTALGEIDAAVAKAEQAAAIPVPKKGLFGGGQDAHDAAVAERVKLLAPAATAIKGAIAVLDANGGYDEQPQVDYRPAKGGYEVPRYGLGDNAEDIASISAMAVTSPVKHKWVNDFPWQDNPTTSLEEMVGYVTEMAGTITRGEAMISLRDVTDMTAELLYDKRAAELSTPQLQQLQDAILAVRTLGDSRFADDRLRGALSTLPAQVLVDGKLTTDPGSLAALEDLHRSTVVAAGTAKVETSVAARLEQAKELAAAGDTAGAREIYEELAASA